MCPICGSKHTYLVPYADHLNQMSLRKVYHIFLQTLNACVGILTSRWHWLRSRCLFSPGFGHIQVCKECGYGKFTKNLDPEIMSYYYTYQYGNVRGTATNEEKAKEVLAQDFKDPNSRAYKQLSFVNSAIGSTFFNDKKTLEIGGGSALFSRLLKHQNQSTKVYIVEPGSSWQEYYETCGLQLASNYYPDDTLGEYSYIHTSHWLEHILDLDETIKQLAENLNVRGHLYIEVPLCDASYWKREYPDGPHIHFFTQHSLELACERYFDVVKTEVGTDVIKSLLKKKA